MSNKLVYIIQDNKGEGIRGFLAGFGIVWLFIEFSSALFEKFKICVETNNVGILILSIIISLGYGLYHAWPPTNMVKRFKASNTEICIKIGDILLQPHNLVITSSDYLDTSIPQGQKISLKHQMIDKFFSDNIQTLDDLINKSIINQGIEGEFNHLKNGKQLKFPIGTIAVIPVQQKKSFLLF